MTIKLARRAFSRLHRAAVTAARSLRRRCRAKPRTAKLVYRLAMHDPRAL